MKAVACVSAASMLSVSFGTVSFATELQDEEVVTVAEEAASDLEAEVVLNEDTSENNVDEDVTEEDVAQSAVAEENAGEADENVASGENAENAGAVQDETKAEEDTTAEETAEGTNETTVAIATDVSVADADRESTISDEIEMIEEAPEIKVSTELRKPSDGWQSETVSGVT